MHYFNPLAPSVTIRAHYAPCFSDVWWGYLHGLFLSLSKSVGFRHFLLYINDPVNCARLFSATLNDIVFATCFYIDEMEGINFVGITLKVALDSAYASNLDTEVAEVFIEPPEGQVPTDEDSADEDEGGLADNLSSRQLTAGTEIRFTNSRRLGGIADDSNSDLQNEISAGTSSNGYLMEENIGNMSTSNTEKTNKTELKLHKVPAFPKYCDDADSLFTEHYFPKDNYDMNKYMTH
ncbi:hypothetical protein JTB14_005008 [Gonioctena quinquepunctata]|nr:hypothetical protein JTB14_005008 [Gonioctena quinquepunctata]